MAEAAAPGAGAGASPRRNSTASNASSASDDGGLALFADPPGYYPPSPPPTTERHALGRSGLRLTLHLVGHSVLEAHRLWNGSRVLADYLEAEEAAGRRVIAGKTVLELGAGAALPGIVCGFVLGARRVVVTDYPDPDLVATMRKNIGEAEVATAAAAAAAEPPALSLEAATLSPVPAPTPTAVPSVIADGYVWGADEAPLLAHLKDLGLPDDPNPPRYDVLLLADLLFRHAEHAKIARSVARTLRRAPASRAYVFFTSYRPWLRHKDLAFFGDARDAGLVVEHLLERRLAQPPLFFEKDPGDPGVRSTVSGYALRWPDPAAGEDPRAFWPPPGGIPNEEGVEGVVVEEEAAPWIHSTDRQEEPPSQENA